METPGFAAPPGGSSGGPMATVHLGDVVQRVAITTFEELRILLTSMRSWTPELRTVKMKGFLAKAKKRLASLLALCKWLQIGDVRKHFACLDKLNFEITNLENNLNEIQDGMYFTHRDLFAKRVRSINVKMGRDVMATGKYGYLSVPIFSCGLMPQPAVVEHARLRRDLDIFIRSKLLLSDPIPPASPNCMAKLGSTVENGFLRIQKPNMFEVLLSLQYADEAAPWEVIGFKLLSDDSVRDMSSSTRIGYHGSKEFETNVLSLLRRLSRTEPNLLDVFKADNRTEVPDADARPRLAPMDIESDTRVSETKSQADSEQPDHIEPPLTLKRILKICQYSAESFVIRILYAQALRLKQQLLAVDAIDVVYTEQDLSANVQVKFWKSAVTR
jgi:hypothetical protein